MGILMFPESASWNVTVSGKRIYLDPNYFPLNIYDIEDIAHHLANYNRWGGATKIPMNVAHHSCIVSDMMGGSLEGLMHDAQEAYLGDMVTPLKALLADYRRIEDAMQHNMAIFFRYINPKLLRTVKLADKRAMAQEARDICAPFVSDFQMPEPPKEKLEPWSWERSKEEFLDRWRILNG